MMIFEPTEIRDVVIIKPQLWEDRRGYFFESFKRDEFLSHGVAGDFVQDNVSRSGRGVLRGLHYQIKQPQGKLIRVAVGEIFDVAVDLRRSSPMFGQWVGARISAENKLMIWVPPGFAHGFYVLSGLADLIYKVTDYRFPEWERTLAWNDRDVGIEWPIGPGGAPLLSDKDAAGRPLREAESYE